jgi:hypothetical protein
VLKKSRSFILFLKINEPKNIPTKFPNKEIAKFFQLLSNPTMPVKSLNPSLNITSNPTEKKIIPEMSLLFMYTTPATQTTIPAKKDFTKKSTRRDKAGQLNVVLFNTITPFPNALQNGYQSPKNSNTLQRAFANKYVLK